jgi:hypothetical protein
MKQFNAIREDGETKLEDWDLSSRSFQAWFKRWSINSERKRWIECFYGQYVLDKQKEQKEGFRSFKKTAIVIGPLKYQNCHITIACEFTVLSRDFKIRVLGSASNRTDHRIERMSLLNLPFVFEFRRYSNRKNADIICPQFGPQYNQ